MLFPCSKIKIIHHFSQKLRFLAFHLSLAEVHTAPSNGFRGAHRQKAVKLFMRGVNSSETPLTEARPNSETLHLLPSSQTD